MKWFSYDSPLINRLNTAADFILVNILFLICCLPVVTIGAARTALFSVGFVWINKDDGGVKEFLRAFRKNFRSCLLPWVFLLVCGLFLIFDIYICVKLPFPGSTVFLLVSVILLLFFLLFQTQIFPFCAKFNCTLRQLFGNAGLLMLAHPLRSIAILVLEGLPVFLFFWSPYAFVQFTPLWILCYFSLIGLLCSKIMNKVYVRLEAQMGNAAEPLPEDEEEDAL